jgi:hypothetical protein
MIIDPELRWSEERRKHKPLLTLPFIDELNVPRFQEKVNDLLKTAAAIVKSTNLLYRWKKYSGQTHFGPLGFRHENLQ